ncbi:hydroxymethylglutaryl-CoA lyase [Arenimonas sp.]|jgi:hydroxymethylglutaryl-CoA lyase|uniref:hydroxymethylglutaryl-CoA lyase n=1 Tax=Arenimonas sp. TaxID=1872635 RepID=UPI0037C12C24
MTDHVRIVEVAARDGLQNEPGFVATADKIELIRRLADSGLRTIEATSFVSPKWVPQLADAEALFAQLPIDDGLRYPVLVPNLKGYERAVACGVREVAVFAAASEAFSMRNINASIDESIARFQPVLERAMEDGIAVRGYISTVLGCPYQGAVDTADVVRLAKTLKDMGCYEISLGDTIGVGTAHAAHALVKAVASEIPMEAIAVHFHDTYGQALANVYACLETGVRTVDASVSGAGGCPYAKGASGNLATEDLVYALHGMGFATGVDLARLVETGVWLSRLLGRPSASKVNRAMHHEKP